MSTKTFNKRLKYGILALLLISIITISVLIYADSNSQTQNTPNTGPANDQTLSQQTTPTPTAKPNAPPAPTATSKPLSSDSSSTSNTQNQLYSPDAKQLSKTLEQLTPQQLCDSFLTQVAGLNLNEYNVTNQKVTNTQVVNSTKTQISISEKLVNTQRTLSVAVAMVDSKIMFYDLSLVSGSFPTSQLTFQQIIDASKTAIDNYENVFGASYCSGFSQAVPSMNDPQNQTVTQNQITTKTTFSAVQSMKYFSLDWRPAAEADWAARSVQLTVSNNGVVTSFADHLGIYQYGTQTVTTTEQQATATAMPYINSYAQQNSRVVATVNATFTYTSGDTMTGGDRFLLYPVWTVVANYEGGIINNVSGYTVTVAADSGQVKSAGINGWF